MAEIPKEINLDLNFGPMKQMAVEIHEMFTAYVDAGFTREEALTVTLNLLSTAMLVNRGTE